MYISTGEIKRIEVSENFNQVQRGADRLLDSLMVADADGSELAKTVWFDSHYNTLVRFLEVHAALFKEYSDIYESMDEPSLVHRYRNGDFGFKPLSQHVRDLKRKLELSNRALQNYTTTEGILRNEGVVGGPVEPHPHLTSFRMGIGAGLVLDMVGWSSAPYMDYSHMDIQENSLRVALRVQTAATPENGYTLLVMYIPREQLAWANTGSGHELVIKVTYTYAATPTGVTVFALSNPPGPTRLLGRPINVRLPVEVSHHAEQE